MLDATQLFSVIIIIDSSAELKNQHSIIGRRTFFAWEFKITAKVRLHGKMHVELDKN